MTDWVKKVEEEGKEALPRDIQKALNKFEGIPGNPADVYMERNGFVDIRKEEYRRGRIVATHPETEGLVYKIAPGRGQWQNHIECWVWDEKHHHSFDKEIPEEIFKYLAPILDFDRNNDEATWLITPEADMEAPTLDESIEMMEDMLSHGWVVTDHHKDNIGEIDGQVMFIDYAQLKPKRYLREEWREVMEAYNW